MSATADEDLARSLRDTHIHKDHSLKNVVPFKISTYPRDDRNLVEVELQLGGFVRDESAIQAVVAEDGNSLNATVGSHKHFANEARMGKQLGPNFHEDDVRYNAYRDGVQKVRRDDKEKLKGKYYFDEPQEIALPMPCLRTIVKKKLHHHPTSTYDGQDQFMTWYTLVLEGAERRIGVEHAAHSAAYDRTPDEDDIRPADSDEF